MARRWHDPAAIARYLTGETTPHARRDVLRAAMEGERKVAATYTRRRDGVTLEYMLRPYSVRVGSRGRRLLYAQDHKHGSQIHAFDLARMTGLTLFPRAPFHPAWPTEPGTAALV